MIRITRGQSVFLAVVIVGAFFAAVALASRSHRPGALPPTPLETPGSAAVTPTPAPTETAAPAGTDSQFTLKNFHRSEMRDGRKLWEVEAKTGRYFPETQRAEITEATVWFFQKDGKTIKLTSQNASLSLSGGALQVADVKGSVEVIYNDEVTIRTEEAHVDQVNNRVWGEVPVTIVNDRLELHGNRIEADMKSHKLVLSDGVRTVLKAKE